MWAWCCSLNTRLTFIPAEQADPLTLAGAGGHKSRVTSGTMDVCLTAAIGDDS